MNEQAPYFHADSGCVRFWIDIDAQSVGASISQQTLHFRFRPGAQGDDAMETFRAHSAEIEAAVRRRIGEGALQPVMLREHDLRAVAG